MAAFVVSWTTMPNTLRIHLVFDTFLESFLQPRTRTLLASLRCAWCLVLPLRSRRVGCCFDPVRRSKVSRKTRCVCTRFPPSEPAQQPVDPLELAVLVHEDRPIADPLFWLVLQVSEAAIMTDQHGRSGTSGGTRSFFFNARSSDGRMYVTRNMTDEHCHMRMTEKGELCCHASPCWCSSCSFGACKCELSPHLPLTMEPWQFAGPKAAD